MVNFNFSYAPGTSLQQMVGFETAGRVWSSLLSDNVTVNVYAGISNGLSSNVIGGALPGIRASQSYESIRNQLEADATSDDDQTATKNLQAGKEYKAKFDLFSKGKRGDDEAKSDTLNLTRADAKAMGFVLADGNTALDGVVVFGSLVGSSYSWNYDYARSSSAPANSLDFLSTVIHEIGHILGFVSGVDKPGWLNSSVETDAEKKAYQLLLDERITYTTALDLFRYSNATLGKDRNDLSYGSKGGAKYFSIDGNSAIAQFSTGKNTSLGGSGEQASHWKQGTTSIMDPTLAPGARESITSIDLRALDVIGWNLAPTAANPNLNLSALVGQSQQGLAQRLGQTVTWLNANASTAAQSLSRDRSQDIATMIQNSQVYDWGTRPPGFPPPPPTGLSQVIDLLQAETVFTSFDTLDPDPEFTVASTGKVISSTSLSNAAKVKAAGSASEQFAYLPVQSSTLPAKLSSVEMGQVIQSMKSSIYAEQPQGRISGRLKSITTGRMDSAGDSFSSKSTSRKLSPVRDLSTVDTIDILAL